MKLKRSPALEPSALRDLGGSICLLYVRVLRLSRRVASG